MKKKETTSERVARFMAKFAVESSPLLRTVLVPHKGQAGPYDSKMGGVPYWMKDRPWPLASGRFEGRPLRFLAQVNLSLVPHVPGFPESGILQVFAGCDGHEAFGLDFEEPDKQTAFRVIYHETATSDKSLLITEAEMPVFQDDDYPFQGEYVLEAAEAKPQYMTGDDWRFGECACRIYNGLFGKDATSVFDKNSIDDDDGKFCEMMCESVAALREGDFLTQMGGYPFFTQFDPREGNSEKRKALQELDVLLLQIDSCQEEGIMWGDCGVANFFISSEALARKDFSHVLYNWDCY